MWPDLIGEDWLARVILLVLLVLVLNQYEMFLSSWETPAGRYLADKE